jgi:hypothetical protein
MPDLKLLGLASSLRARAEEVLAKAEIMKDTDAKQKMRDVTVSYKKLAESLEERAYGSDKL